MKSTTVKDFKLKTRKKRHVLKSTTTADMRNAIKERNDKKQKERDAKYATVQEKKKPAVKKTEKVEK